VLANVPGTIAGMYSAFKQYGSGKVTWQQIVAPAIRAARDGYVVSDGLATTLSTEREHFLKYEGSRKLFFPNGKPLVAGDTLKKIASKFNTSIEALEKANNLTSTSIIRTGQMLVVGKAASAHVAASQAKTEAVPLAKATPSVVAKPEPVQSAAAKAAPVETKEVAKEAPTAAGESYVVAKGDNPYSIAKKFKVTQDALMKANNIDDPRKLKIGQKLVIP